MIKEGTLIEHRKTVPSRTGVVDKIIAEEDGKKSFVIRWDDGGISNEKNQNVRKQVTKADDLEEEDDEEGKGLILHAPMFASGKMPMDALSDEDSTDSSLDGMHPNRLVVPTSADLRIVDNTQAQTSREACIEENPPLQVEKADNNKKRERDGASSNEVEDPFIAGALSVIELMSVHKLKPLSTLYLNSKHPRTRCKVCSKHTCWYCVECSTYNVDNYRSDGGEENGTEEKEGDNSQKPRDRIIGFHNPYPHCASSMSKGEVVADEEASECPCYVTHLKKIIMEDKEYYKKGLQRKRRK